MRGLVTVIALSAGGLLALCGLLFVNLPGPERLVRENPRTTALIEQRRAEARRAHHPFHPRQAWVGMDRISPGLAQAVLVSEDASFYSHGAFDFTEIRAAAKESLLAGRGLRGASTLTQQLAKNLWLGTERSPWRKLKEAVLAVKLERTLSKRRILALYLNVAEWGEGVFGAQAAAQARFGVEASDLTTAQAALLAAMLPAPRRADLAHPSRWLARRARRVLDRLYASGHIDAPEHAHASADLERLLEGASGDEEVPEDDDPSALPVSPPPSAR